ncbi:MAG: Wzy polymerase domain-containing protein [Thiotrichales bacterium]|nr:Wzy polymerase domain-containing protein [Thiotrichales bacterium]
MPVPLPCYISLTCIGLVWILPFINPFHHAPLGSFVNEWIATALAIIALSGCILAKPGEIRIPASCGFFAAFIIFIALQSFTIDSPYPHRSWTYLVYLVLALSTVVLAATVRAGIGLEKTVHYLVPFFITGAVISACLGLVQFFDFLQPLKFLLAREPAAVFVYGNTEQANHFGQHIFIGLLTLVHVSRSKPFSPFNYVFLLLLVFALALCGSRTIWLYFIFTVCFYIFLSKTGKPDYRYHLILVSSAFFLFVAVQAGIKLAYTYGHLEKGIATSIDRISDEFTTADTDTGQGVSGLRQRIALWRNALGIFLEKPVLGHGTDSFAWKNFQSISDPHWIYSIHSHNLLLEILVYYGIAGFILLTLQFLTWCKSQSYSGSDRSYARHFIVNVLIVALIHSMLELPLWYMYFLVVFFFCYGLLENRYYIIQKNRLTGVINKLLLLAAGIFCFVTASRYAHMTADIDPDKYNKYYENQEVTSSGLNFILQPWIESLEYSGMDYSSRNITEKLEVSRRQYAWRPTSYIAIKHAVYLALDGDKHESISSLKKALDAYPQHGRKYRNLLTGIYERYQSGPVLNLIYFMDNYQASSKRTAN